MEGSVGAPPQRVCPKCARISWATGPQCPYCTAKFRRQPGVAPWMLVLTAVVVLLGVGVMFYITVQQVDERVDDVQRTVTSNFDKLRTDVDRQIQQATQNSGTVPVPTVTPVPTEVPTVDPNVTPEATEDPLSPEATTTPDASASETPTPEEPEIINP